MSQADGSIIIDTRIDQSGLSKGLSSMRSAAVAGMAAITAAIGAAAVAVINLGSEFEQANAKASTLFGDAQVDMQQYQGKMLELSNKTGLAATDLGNTMYDALSAGIPASDDMSESLGFLEKNSKLAKAGFTDINTATTATAKVLNAYKMDVSETDRVHKVLMQTQNKGITTVNELGSVLSQVTPTAAAMNVSFEQVGAALANMTAQGTPTAQATTQLNQLFAELGKSGTTGQKALLAAAEGTKYAGKSFQQLMKEGVPLNEVIDLMADYADKNGLSMVDMFSSIESGKAALAVSGKNAKQYTENLKAMKTQTDVVGDAYDKVTDTFKEKSAKVVNSLKNVGIAAYSKFEKPLKKSMDVAQKSVDELSRDMSSGKLGKSVDKIADSFGSIIEVTAKFATKVIPLVVDGFALLVDHGKELTIGLMAVGTAMGAMKGYNNFIEPTIKSFMKAKEAVDDYNVGLVASSMAGKKFNGTLSMGQAALGLLSGQTEWATVKQATLNAVQSISPMGWVAITAGTLTAALGLLCLSLDDVESETKLMQEAVEKTDETWKQLKITQEEQLSSDLAQVESTKRLRDELSYLVDENGKVKDGCKARVDFILGEVNSALGTEYEATDGVIRKYDELNGTIDNLIQKKRVKAILDAQEPLYQEAINEADKEGIEIGRLKAEIVGNENEQQAIQNELIAKYGSDWENSAKKASDARINDLNSLVVANADKTAALKGFEESYNTHMNEIVSYEHNMTLAASENSEDWLKIQTDIQAGSAKTYEEKKTNLEKDMRKEEEYYNWLIKEQKEGNENISKEQIESSKKRLESKQEELEGLQSKVNEANPLIAEGYRAISIKSLESLKSKSKEYFGVSEKQMDDLISGLKSKDPEVRKKAENTAKDMLKNVKSKNGQYPDVGINALQGVIDGVSHQSGSVFTAMANVASGMLSSLMNKLQIKSPSRAFKRIAKFVPAGIAEGIKENEGVVTKEIDTLSDSMLDQFKGIDMEPFFEKLRSAIYEEHAKMSMIVNTQAKAEVLRSAAYGHENEPLKATVDGQSVIKINLDGREMAVALAPLIGEELVFK